MDEYKFFPQTNRAEEEISIVEDADSEEELEEMIYVLNEIKTAIMNGDVKKLKKAKFLVSEVFSNTETKFLDIIIESGICEAFLEMLQIEDKNIVSTTLDLITIFVKYMEEVLDFFLSNGIFDACVGMVQPPIGPIPSKAFNVLLQIAIRKNEYIDRIYEEIPQEKISEIVSTPFPRKEIIKKRSPYVPPFVDFIHLKIQQGTTDVERLTLLPTIATCVNLELPHSELLLKDLRNFINKKELTTIEFFETGIQHSLPEFMNVATYYESIQISKLLTCLLDNGWDSVGFPLEEYLNMMDRQNSPKAQYSLMHTIRRGLEVGESDFLNRIIEINGYKSIYYKLFMIIPNLHERNIESLTGFIEAPFISKKETIITFVKIIMYATTKQCISLCSFEEHSEDHFIILKSLISGINFDDKDLIYDCLGALQKLTDAFSETNYFKSFCEFLKDQGIEDILTNDFSELEDCDIYDDVIEMRDYLEQSLHKLYVN